MTHLAATHWARRRECAPVGKWHPLTPWSACDADLSAVRAPQGCAALLASSFWDLARPVLYSYMSHINLYSYVVSGSGLGTRSLRCASSTLITDHTLVREIAAPRRRAPPSARGRAPRGFARAGRAGPGPGWGVCARGAPRRARTRHMKILDTHDTHLISILLHTRSPPLSHVTVSLMSIIPIMPYMRLTMCPEWSV